VQFVWSPALLDEFETVCSRPRFRQWFTVEEGQTIAAIVRDAGERHDDAPGSTRPPSDDGDAYLVDLAVAANVDCLVTGDAALLNHQVAGLRVVTPRALLDVLDDIEGQQPQ
jgi:putative PIN family toxin of toxin-antitoxin system